MCRFLEPGVMGSMSYWASSAYVDMPAAHPVAILITELWGKLAKRDTTLHLSQMHFAGREPLETAGGRTAPPSRTTHLNGSLKHAARLRVNESRRCSNSGAERPQEGGPQQIGLRRQLWRCGVRQSRPLADLVAGKGPEELRYFGTASISTTNPFDISGAVNHGIELINQS
jgi:hypothetical protein